MIAIASLSTRFLSEVASQSHQKVFSMDVFGDLETLKHSEKWLSIGSSSPFPSIDEDRFLDALERTKRSGCTFCFFQRQIEEAINELINEKNKENNKAFAWFIGD